MFGEMIFQVKTMASSPMGLFMGLQRVYKEEKQSLVAALETPCSDLTPKDTLQELSWQSPTSCCSF